MGKALRLASFFLEENKRLGGELWADWEDSDLNMAECWRVTLKFGSANSYDPTRPRAVSSYTFNGQTTAITYDGNGNL